MQQGLANSTHLAAIITSTITQERGRLYKAVTQAAFANVLFEYERSLSHGQIANRFYVKSRIQQTLPVLIGPK